MTFRTVQTAEGHAFGLLGRASHSVVPIQRCLLQAEAMNEILAQVSKSRASSHAKVDAEASESASSTCLCIQRSPQHASLQRELA